MHRITELLAALLLLLAIFVTVEATRSITHADALLLPRACGSPTVLVISRGIVHLAGSNAPVWSPDQQWCEVRQLSNADLLDARDLMVVNANWQIGYTLTPAPSGSVAAGLTTTASSIVERSCLGFSIGKGTEAFTLHGKWFAFGSVPAWAVVPMLLVLPARCIACRIRQRRRGQRGQCLICGYDLRQSPDRCPECGAEASAPLK